MRWFGWGPDGSSTADLNPGKLLPEAGLQS